MHVDCSTSAQYFSNVPHQTNQQLTYFLYALLILYFINKKKTLKKKKKKKKKGWLKPPLWPAKGQSLTKPPLKG
jgi:hypothetical protein